MSEQISSSDLDSLVTFQTELAKLEPDDDEVYEETEEEMMVGETQVLEEDVNDALLQGVVINDGENEMITSEVAESLEQGTYLFLQQPSDSGSGQFFTQARTSDGNLIQLRQIPSTSTKLPTIRPAPASPKKQNVTKLVISGGNTKSPIMIPSSPGTPQQIKLIGTTSSPGPSVQRISLSQAQQMGLLGSSKQLISPSNLQNLNLNKLAKTTSSSSPRITMITQGQKTPTKILPAPSLKPIISAQPTIRQLSGTTQKVIIRQAGGSRTLNSSPGSGGIGGQIIRIPATQNIISSSGDGIQLPGNRQFVRIVASPNTPATTKTPASPMKQQVISPAPLKVVPIAPAQTIQLATKPQKIMIPATTSGRVSQVSTAAVTQLGGTLVPTAGGNFMVLPTQIYEQLQGATPIATELKLKQPEQRLSPKSLLDARTESHAKLALEANLKRKPCNCTKSQCLKLYCDCFANGEFCFNCNCNTCFNNLEHEEDRQRAIRACLERNPTAFKPKIGKAQVGDERRHNKGCNCKRSGCLKNYCECFEAKIPCTHMCKCVGCRNLEDSEERKMDRENVVLAAGLRARQQHLYAASRARLTMTKRGKPVLASQGLTRQPFGFMNQRLVDATCHCLLAQAQEGESMEMDEVQIEQKILQEFGECLKQFIECSASVDHNL
ncbi:protein lin-54 homolog [Neocloeon triangulifer]|uniref:protein lin-54 homolog n=1 Tax=Neocloeon triangulifer TaxID=2078957 RepID=UPI00286EE355|nr:protein lin-54 homolog [Neocloeon triangulifer]XP_059471576.1 protein lin-54 homolog [Neocloeon triangulifer]